MRRLDRYLVRAFLFPFLVSLVALVGLFIIAEILTQIEDFIRYGAGARETAVKILTIYALRAPYLVSFVAPMCMVIGAAFGLCELNRNNELLAMKACGVSLLRAIMPIMAVAAAIAILLAANREYVIPHTENRATRMLYEAVGQTDRFSGCVGVVAEDRTEIVEISSDEGGWRLVGANPAYHAKYSFVRKEMRDVLIAVSLPGDRTALVRADSAESARDGWLLRDVRLDEETVISQALWRTSLRPQSLAYHRVEVGVRPLNEIVRLVRAYPSQPRYRVILYSRLTYPLTGIILMMLSLPLLLGDYRLLNHRLLGIGASVVVCLLFYGVQLLARDLGDSNMLAPAVAGLAPVALGLAAGGVLLDSVRT